jgi:hypothetical protein
MALIKHQIVAERKILTLDSFSASSAEGEAAVFG